MKVPSVFLFCAFACCSSISGTNPVQQVITLLEDLTAKVKKDGMAEEAAFKEYMEWCKDTKTQKGFEIQTSESQIEELSATLAKATSDVSASSSKIEELAGSVAESEKDLSESSVVRESEKAEFVKMQVELVDAVNTLERAINILQKKMGSSALLQSTVNTKDVKAMVQALGTILDAAALSFPDKQKLLGLVQSKSGDAEEDDETGPPAATAYESHSGNIIEVLEDMLEKAEASLAELRKKEANDKHNFDMMASSLKAEMNNANKELDEIKKASAAAVEIKATSSGDLAKTQKSLATTQESLKTVEGDCSSAEADHEVSVKGRADELKALDEAIKAITSSTGGAEGIVYEASSFLQINRLSSVQDRARLANIEVVTLVRQLAKKERSIALNQLAGRIAAVLKFGTGNGEDPFVKVKGLITDMIKKLEAEASAEASQKSYCDEQTAANVAKKEELSGLIDMTKSKIDKAEARATTLTNEVKELQDELAKLASSQAEMDKIRVQEAEVFKTTSADLKEGLSGCKTALKVLREYYATTGLLQQPTTHSASGDAGSGIISMLEVIETDFGTSLSAAEVAEAEAASKYEKTTQENKIVKGIKEQDVKYKSQEVSSLQKDIAELKSSLASTVEEQDAVLSYGKSLYSQCTITAESYEERKLRREAEIAGLKEALQILEGETVFLQKPHRRASLRGGVVGL
mmetsp:Transcript_26878/g.47776  ORF Transcript_26878/g.47776 Transcript_26878/m.47776 type:complete len:694 (+) Transcript_26878:69-2150(+)